MSSLLLFFRFSQIGGLRYFYSQVMVRFSLGLNYTLMMIKLAIPIH